MQKITSTSNNLIKQMAALKDGRGELILIEGEKLIGEALANGYALDKLFIEEEKWEKYSKKFNIKPQNIYMLSSHVFAKLCNTVAPQGIIAVISAPKRALIAPNGKFLVLDNLQDPGNLGTILRSAIGAGFETIYALNCVNHLNPKVIRSSMGAVFSTQIFDATFEQFEKILDKRISLICADMSGENLFKFKPPDQNFGIVVGNEGKGVSENLRKLCSHFVAIPMNDKLESLNVSVAASLFMYVLTNK
jgi:TrmH family RNA methyltransferase